MSCHKVRTEVNSDMHSSEEGIWQVMEMRNMKTQLKDSLEGFNKRLEQTEEIISKLEYRTFEILV